MSESKSINENQSESDMDLIEDISLMMKSIQTQMIKGIFRQKKVLRRL